MDAKFKSHTYKRDVLPLSEPFWHNHRKITKEWLEGILKGDNKMQI
jgi:hypothetical protein